MRNEKLHHHHHHHDYHEIKAKRFAKTKEKQGN